MATIIGDKYDHIRINNGTNTTVHYLSDSVFNNWSNGTESLNYLTVKSCTPNSNKVFKIYIDDDGALIVRKGDNWYDVDYYDGDRLLHTESIWNRGANATWNETPTKPPTCDTTYTFAGWALTPEGAVDANAKKNITDDRKLYAQWTAAAREYTITTIYDGDTIDTRSVAYGSLFPDLILYDAISSYDGVMTNWMIFDTIELEGNLVIKKGIASLAHASDIIVDTNYIMLYKPTEEEVDPVG